jgi:hypothetical protein
MGRGRWWAIHTAVALTVAIVLVGIENVAIARWFPHLTRLTTDFSAAYLRRELRDLATGPPPTVFLGDSVLWGYRIAPDQTAVALLAARGCVCRNLAFKTGNSPNYYALARLLLGAGVQPRAVVVEVNQAELNVLSPDYRTLHPGVAALAEPYLTSADRARLILPPARSPVTTRAEQLASSVSLLYAMRSDVRETLFGDPTPPPLPHLSVEMYEGTYDLVPLNERNVGVEYFERAADVLRNAGIPVLAFLTPTNHALMHEDIDNRLYRSNGAYLKRLLERRGARVLDLDASFPTVDFIDNAHLTPAGQQRLAAILERALDGLRPSRDAAARVPSRPRPRPARGRTP